MYNNVHVHFINLFYLSLSLPLSLLQFFEVLSFVSSSILPSSSQSNNDDSATSTDDSTDEVKPPSSSEKRRSTISALEKITKGSIVGALLPPLLAVMSDPVHCTLPLAMKLLPCGNSLGRRNAEV